MLFFFKIWKVIIVYVVLEVVFILKVNILFDEMEVD